MSLNKALENLKFDKRLIDLNIKMGRLTQEEATAYNKSLQDLEANSEKIEIEKEDSSEG